jgi:hypothetical protein
MRIPITFVLFRLTTGLLTILILAAFGLGLSGRGPAAGLHGWTISGQNWLHINTGVRLP